MASERSNTTRRRAVRAAAGVTAVSAPVETASAARNVVGVWRLVGGRMTDPAGKSVGVPYGPRGMGIVSLTSDGRMMAVLVDGRAKLADGAKREYSSYCGNYTFDGGTLVTTVDAASDPGRMGSQQVRKVRFEGDRMVLVPPEIEMNGAKIHRELTWERMSPVSL
ncbi:MAG TPA: lipocalin-like domain-containing protein [Reyranella sp.]|nr:lipocalin-like domain-containing protein [Reyranella sp.]